MWQKLNFDIFWLEVLKTRITLIALGSHMPGFVRYGHNYSFIIDWRPIPTWDLHNILEYYAHALHEIQYLDKYYCWHYHPFTPLTSCTPTHIASQAKSSYHSHLVLLTSYTLPLPICSAHSHIIGHTHTPYIHPYTHTPITSRTLMLFARALEQPLGMSQHFHTFMLIQTISYNYNFL